MRIIAIETEEVQFVQLQFQKRVCGYIDKVHDHTTALVHVKNSWSKKIKKDLYHG